MEDNINVTGPEMLTGAIPSLKEFFIVKVNGVAILYPFITRREAEHAFEGLNPVDKTDAQIVTVDEDGAQLLFG